MAQVVLFFVSSGTEIWQRWYYSRAINRTCCVFVRLKIELSKDRLVL